MKLFTQTVLILESKNQWSYFSKLLLKILQKEHFLG